MKIGIPGATGQAGRLIAKRLGSIISGRLRIHPVTCHCLSETICPRAPQAGTLAPGTLRRAWSQSPGSTCKSLPFLPDQYPEKSVVHLNSRRIITMPGQGREYRASGRLIRSRKYSDEERELSTNYTNLHERKLAVGFLWLRR